MQIKTMAPVTWIESGKILIYELFCSRTHLIILPTFQGVRLKKDVIEWCNFFFIEVIQIKNTCLHYKQYLAMDHTNKKESQAFSHYYFDLIMLLENHYFGRRFQIEDRLLARRD